MLLKRDRTRTETPMVTYGLEGPPLKYPQAYRPSHDAKPIAPFYLILWAKRHVA